AASVNMRPTTPMLNRRLVVVGLYFIEFLSLASLLRQRINDQHRSPVARLAVAAAACRKRHVLPTVNHIRRRAGDAGKWQGRRRDQFAGFGVIDLKVAV